MNSAWIHNKEISFQKPREALLMLKGVIEQAIEQKKKELAKITALRDSFK